MFDRKIKIALVLSSLLSIVACSDYLDEFQNEYEDSFVALDIPVSSEEALSSEEGKSSDKGTSSSSQEDDSGNSSANSSASENSSDRDDSSSSVNSSDSSNSSSSVNSSGSGDSSSSVNSSSSVQSSSSVNSSSSVPSFGTCAPSISTVTTNSTVMWLFSWNDADTTLAAIEKAMASYKWLSEGGSPASGTTRTFSTSYASSGMKTASVEVTVRSKGTQVIECSTLQVTSGADETSTVQCQSGDMWCKNESYRVNTGIDAGLDNGGQWWAKTDVIEPSPGASKLNWTPALGTDSSFNSVIDHCNGLCGTYNLDKGNLDYDPWVEIGFSIAGMAEPSSGNIPIDVSNWGGLCFTYTSSKAPTLVLHFETEIEEYFKYDLPKKSIPIKNNPGEQCVAWSDFNQSRLKDSLKISGEEAAKYVTDIGFKIAGSDGSAGDFNIIRITKKNNTGDAKMSAWSYLNPDRNYALIRDSRDGHFYKTVEIGEQTWMAQNLNYVPGGDMASYCYDDDMTNCNVYGRLYTWDAAQNVCPDGWLLPSKEDAITLLRTVSGETSYDGGMLALAGTKLKSSMGWNSDYSGTDDYGFSALPTYGEGGSFANFYTIQEVHSSDGNVYGGLITIYNDDQAALGHDDKTHAYSVRCLQGPLTGTMTDGRDGKTYKTVRIGNQVWMAENLNYAYTERTADLDSSSFCYDNDPANCDTYGRLYLWNAAMDSAGAIEGNIASGCGTSAGCSIKEPFRGVCPSGWHLPSQTEFKSLITAVGGESVAGVNLKSTSGWRNDGNGNGTYFFNAQPAGYCTNYPSFDGEGEVARFWGSSEYESGESVYHLGLIFNSDAADTKSIMNIHGLSVRCIED